MPSRTRPHRPVLWIATANPGKTREFKRLFGARFHVRDLHSFKNFPVIRETGRTFEANAKIKALALSRILPGQLILADDSGLVVPALRGRPGVRSARFSGPNATNESNRIKLLRVMKKLKNAARKAYFQATLVLANFSSTTGDHLFVNKMIYQFRKPKRAETFVFTTDRIEGIESGLRLRGIEGSQYYIKRCVAIGGDVVEVRPPELWINGAPAEAAACAKVASKTLGYPGYTFGPSYLGKSGDQYRIPGKDYWAMGDNSPNSFDSRGWGPVPAVNLVGKGAFVYWPFTKRWGLIQ